MWRPDSGFPSTETQLLAGVQHNQADEPRRVAQNLLLLFHQILFPQSVKVKRHALNLSASHCGSLALGGRVSHLSWLNSIEAAVTLESCQLWRPL